MSPRWIINPKGDPQSFVLDSSGHNFYISCINIAENRAEKFFVSSRDNISWMYNEISQDSKKKKKKSVVKEII